MKPEDIKPQDLRKYSIIPFNAVMDERINKTRALHVLAAICCYVDKVGVTFVSQARLARDLKMSRQAVNKQMMILHDLGYWNYACKRYKGQTTNSIKVVYDEEITTEEQAFSAQTGRDQIKIKEEQGAISEVAGATSKGATLEIAGGATPEVAGGAMPEVAHNENINETNNGYKQIVKVYCNHFLAASNVLGQARRISEREQQMMSTWISHGLLEAEWKVLLSDQVKRCQSQRKDWPQSLAWFAEPVKSSLRRVPNATARSALSAVKKRSERLK
jgi:hypothetical protein